SFRKPSMILGHSGGKWGKVVGGPRFPNFSHLWRADKRVTQTQSRHHVHWQLQPYARRKKSSGLSGALPCATGRWSGHDGRRTRAPLGVSAGGVYQAGREGGWVGAI